MAVAEAAPAEAEAAPAPAAAAAATPAAAAGGISAAVVKELREATGAGMMDCKKALGECGGDLEAAKEVMQRFVSARPDDRIGLLVFGEEAFVQVPPTLDGSELGDFIGDLEIGMAGPNATAVGDAIAVGVKRMKDLKATSKLIILVTDGRSNAGKVQPIDAAQAAKALGVKVYTIGVGTSDIDERGLDAVARTTGGRYYAAPTLKDLAGVYADIDKNEKTSAKVHEYIHRDELYADWLGPAVACFGLAFALSHTLLRRLP